LHLAQLIEDTMISFQVNDMTCGHCVSNLTKVLQAADATAKMRFDLAAHRIDIEPGKADAAALSDAIKQAGYAPVPIEGASGSENHFATPAPKGCCCR
jgi:copper chaperone